MKSDTKSDGSLAQIVEIEFSKRLKDDHWPKGYYYLKELCNPIQTYWGEKRPDIKKSREVADKLARGYRLQRRAFAWMRKMPDYVCEETHLYGEYWGIDRIVGKYDMRLGDSIIEFKTKPEEVPDPETVFKRYPQDLEQLLFYASLSPKETEKHYLVFQLDHQPYNLSVFRVDIGDWGTIRDFLAKRRDNLDIALECSDASNLGRCRYYETGCDFDKNHVCNCGAMNELNLDPIRKVISLTFDGDKKAEMERFRAVHRISSGELYSIWSLLKPRKTFLRNHLGIPDTYEKGKPLESCEEALRKAVYRASDLRPTASELEEARANCLDLLVYPTWRWISIHHSWPGKRGKRVVSAILKVSDKKPQTQPFEAYRVELTLARIATHSLHGAVIVAFPNAGDRIQAFTMSSDESVLREGEDLLRNSISTLNTALEDGRISTLDLCPRWVQRNCSPCPAHCEELAQEDRIPEWS